MMDERTDTSTKNGDGLTAEQIRDDIDLGDFPDLVSDLFRRHGKHCRATFGVRTQHHWLPSLHEWMEVLMDCTVKFRDDFQ